MHVDKWNTQFILVMLCSTQGTNIARVEGLWLVNRHNHSVSENPDDSSEVCMCSPYIVPSKNSTRYHCDIISWCHDPLLWSSSGKTTVHVHRICHNSSVHLPASLPEPPVTIATSEPLHPFLKPNFLPVTLSPRYFGAPLYWSPNLFTKTQTGITSKQGWWMQCID